jgi:hypothetical protein
MEHTFDRMLRNARLWTLRRQGAIRAAARYVAALDAEASHPWDSVERRACARVAARLCDLLGRAESAQARAWTQSEASVRAWMHAGAPGPSPSLLSRLTVSK